MRLRTTSPKSKAIPSTANSVGSAYIEKERRARFGPGHPDLPAEYREFGQPVLIPGDMGRCSYVLVARKPLKNRHSLDLPWGGQVVESHASD
jgi:hypothetical protein